MKRRTVLLLSLGLFFSIAIVVAFVNRMDGRHLGHLDLRLQWVHQAQFAGFYVAKEKGFYQDEQLDVDIEPGGSSFNVPALVATHNADIGIWVGDQVLRARAGQNNMPIRAVGVVFQRSLVCFMVHRDSPINSPQDLAGRTIGVYPGFDSESIYLDLLNRFHVDRNTITEYPAAYSIVPFLQHQVDVWPSYIINEPLVAEERGQHVRCLTPDAYGIKYYSDTVIVRDDFLAGHRDRVVRFLRASQRGWRYALGHPDEAVQIVLKYDPSLHPEHERAMLEALAADVSPIDPLFKMDPEVWAYMADSMRSRGISIDTERALDVADYSIAEEATRTRP